VHLLTRVERQRQRLLAERRLPEADRRPGQLRVGGRGRGDDDGIGLGW
jgi:hypothetical protein